MNKLIIAGVIGQDAKTIAINGKNYAKFSIAVREGKDKTTWVDCVKADDAGKLLPYLLKGTALILEGRASANAYSDKSGKAIGSLTLWVNDLEFQQGGKKERKEDSPFEADDSDLPFD